MRRVVGQFHGKVCTRVREAEFQLKGGDSLIHQDAGSSPYENPGVGDS
jgi:hypothetical protein